jgi:hypothetical protein
MWALPSNKRTYLPRLGGPLCGITTSKADPARCAAAAAALLLLLLLPLLLFKL